ncbi:MAG: DUF2125 domain-containing protein [Chelatococcus sp.]|uniref:DUF2125 domain-containing protein n=1 Tax=unclassified Chelatococcus TaxID=2638111 RepID=UPI001BCD1D5F|nr:MULTISPECIES: DUF2125 domain-containing protein [unclassified Chelatococcus]CAH1659846.1 conserved hypothetical protein [Hyphomicrobiales bacterium]MBS7740999.1 DUF2125 domain-containing protein [Chelatococcus sp. HY11]MBX3536697.1 DUF2125 domain-containing protein [Chelatococcus sp.]MBX3545185.1 DUF2125 domain-containing protein [Chelatococcus sp.]MCO5077818.1 DUF2125 domain-containing protein [Chelatococcus sp.]
MSADTSGTIKRRSRLGLYLPVALLFAIAAGWSVFWFIARNTVNTAVNTWLTREAAQGRDWSCPDRTIGGFPFRFELTCNNLTFAGKTPEGPVNGSMPRLAAVAQIYKPQHVIFEATGPLKVAKADGTIDLTFDWKLLDASVIAAGRSVERVSMVIDQPTLTVAGSAVMPLNLTANTFESHLRRDPSRPPEENTYDFTLAFDGAVVPPLDALLATQTPIKLALDAKVSHARPFTAQSRAEELEAWRQAGGRVQILGLSMDKGQQRLEARGELGLDEAHRPAGTIDASVAGLEQVLARFGIGGQGSNLGALIAGGLARLGARQSQQSQAQQSQGQGDGTAKPSNGLTPLPTVTISNGRVAVGPFAFATVQPLY